MTGQSVKTNKLSWKKKKRKLRKHGEVVRLLGKRRRRRVGGACIWWIDSSAAEWPGRLLCVCWRHCLIDLTLNEACCFNSLSSNESVESCLVCLKLVDGFRYRGSSGAGAAGRISHEIDVTARQTAESGHRTRYWHFQIETLPSSTR